MSPSLTAALAEAWATQGLYLLVFAVILAGLVRGFAGFGTAMIYMPIAGTVLPPVWALAAMMVFDALGPLPNVPRAWRDGRPRELAMMVAGGLLALPFGVWVVSVVSPEMFRWSVAIITIGLLVLLVSGWRYHGALSRPLLAAAGALGGFLGGSTGLAGPPVIMLYMSSRQAIQVVRANILMFLLFTDLVALALMWAFGLLTAVPVLLGLILFVPYMLGNIAGAALFRPERERLYRWLAYLIIAASALSNLPLFD
ncbi:MAG: sulfite exporter TauE/SafE family protein [Rhodobacteraceae bacterium]|nr:sulfite exporter TauE/SafE family protein [Paracoccaceae bacterium]MCB1367057.1 sulfite exporter TauE/SafE family protein [Paracoccaceae bacterium]